jgi:glycosyltransferase involved in cell wall biosynthesis
MDTKQPLSISYSGSLDGYQPHSSNRILKTLKNWFWTYKHDTVDSSTRSAYYLVKAVRVLKERHSVRPEDLQFDFWGNINPLNEMQAKKEGVSEFFRFSGYLPKPESLKRLSESDMLFLPLEKSNVKGQGTLFIPGKLFEYMNSGKPVLGLCEPSDCRYILEQSGLGICVEPDNVEQIAGVLHKYILDRQLLDAIKPRQDYISGFSFRNKTSELAEVLRIVENS